MELELMIPRDPALDPVLVLVGEDSSFRSIVEGLEMDLELRNDASGQLRLLLRLPDRLHVMARSDGLPSELVETMVGLAMKGRPLRLRLGRPPGGFWLDAAVAWRFIDGRGPWLSSCAFLRAGKLFDAVAAARGALARHENEPGWRCWLGDCLIRVNRDEEARALLLEEEALEGRLAHRPGAILALLDWRAGRMAEARRRLHRGLRSYGKHLRSLLLLGELELAAGRKREALPPLERAWRLCGATSARTLVELLERRGAVELLPALRGSHVDLAVPWDDSPSSLRPGSVPEAGSMGAPDPEIDRASEGKEEPGPGGPSSIDECTARDVLYMAAVAMLRDGRIDPEEKLRFQALARCFPLPRQDVRELLRDATAEARSRPAAGEVFEARSFFAELLRRVHADGRVSGDESTLVLTVARALGLAASECRQIRDEVKGETG